MNTLKPFAKILHNISINTSQEESQKVKTSQSTQSIKLSLMIIILTSLYFLVFFLVYKQYENVLWMTLALLFCLLSWLFCEKLKNFFTPIFFLLNLGSSVYSSYLFGKLTYYGLPVTFVQGLVLGYLWGLYEKMICLRFSNFILRVSFFIITTLARLFFIQNALIEFQVYQVYVILISLMVDFFQEKDDKRFSHDSHEDLVKFKNLASSGLSGNLLILTKDLNEELFISDPLSEMIGRDQDTSLMLQWLDQFVIERRSLKDITRANSSSMSQNEQDQTVLTILQDMENKNFLVKSQQKLRFIAQDNNTQKIFEVKVHTTIWDDKDAFVLVFNDILESCPNASVQLADQNKDKMLAMISHELRTPLNGILGVVNILKKDIKEPQQLRYLTVCHNSGELLLNLVNSILDLQQIRDHKFTLKFAKEDLYDLIGGIYDLFKFQFDQKDLFLKFEISPGVPEQIVTDKNRLKQILINLIGNALKFTFSGGVSVLVDLDPVLPGYVHFRVSDTGIGIKEEDLKNLFKMYGKLEQEDAHTNTQGIGFGLEISNQLAKVLAEDEETGGIKVESQVSQGTTFSFSIRDNLFNSLNSEESVGGGINYYEPRVFSENIEDVGIKMTPYLPRNIYTNDRTSSPPAVSGLVSIAENLMPSVSLFRLKRTSIQNHTPQLNPPTKSFNNLKLARSYNNLQRSRGNLSPLHNNLKECSFSDLSPVSIAQNKSWVNNRPKILIVDDNPFNLLVARRIVEKSGYEVETALNGELAIEKTRNCLPSQFFSAVLMDLQMPVMDGYETTKKLREMMLNKEIPEIPIIAVSANDTEDDEKRCKEVGMCKHLSKPLNEDLLKKVLKKASKKENTENTFGEMNGSSLKKFCEEST